MNEEIILFDMDRTIFDTDTLGKNFKKNLVDATQTSIEKIEKINSDYKANLESSTDFNPDEFLKEVEKETKVDLENLNQAFFSSKNFVLYPEAIEIIRKLSEDNFVLGIFSEGAQEWQTKKLILTGIIDYFDPSLIFIERRKLLAESIDKIPNGVRVIDDKKEVIETLANNRPDLKLIWINRLNDEKIETSQIRTIKELNDLLAMD